MFADGYLKLGDFGVSKVLQTLTCTVPPLRVESSLLKNPIPPKL